MFGFNSLFIVTQALILMGLLYAFARQEADFEFSTTVLVMCGILAGNALLIMLLVERLGLFVAIPAFFFTCWVIVQFCWVSWPKGLLITALFFVLSLSIEIGKTWYRTGLLPWSAREETATEEAMSNYERDTQEGMEILKEINESTERMQGIAPRPVERRTNVAAVSAATPPAQKSLAAPVPPAVAPAPPPATTAPPAVVVGSPPVVPSAQAAEAAAAPAPRRPEDWAMARSHLRIRGWVEDVASARSAMVNDQVVPLGGTAYIDYLGWRYTWRLASLDGYTPRWDQLDAVPVPQSP